MLSSLFKPGQFRGLNYEAASRMGAKIIRQAADREDWTRRIDALVELREIMRQQAAQ